MEVRNLSLRDFTQLASGNASNNAKVKLGSDGLKSSNFIMWSSTNQRAMSAFLSTVKKELGPAIADMATSRMHAKFGADTPLNMRVLRDTLDEITRIAQTQINSRDKFLSGIDASKNFDKTFNDAMNASFGMKKINSLMTDNVKAYFKECVKESFMQKCSPGSNAVVDFNNLDKEVTLKNDMARTMRVFTANMSDNAGSSTINLNVVEICKSGIHVSNGAALLAIMPEIKDDSRRINMNDVWQKLFNCPLPEGSDVDKDTLAKQLDTKMREICNERIPGKGGAIMHLCSQFTLDKAVEVLNKRSVELSDFEDAQRFMRMKCEGTSQKVESALARDINRRQGVSLISDGTKVSTPSTINVGDKSFTLGNACDFNFADDKNEFKLGRPSSLTKAILSSVESLGDNGEISAAQRDMVVTLMNQGTPGLALATGIGLFKGTETIFNTIYTEHCPTTINVSKQNDGTINVDVTTSNNKDVICRNGYLKLSFAVDQDGSCKGTDFIFKAPFEQKASSLYQSIKDGSLAKDIAQSEVDRAFADGLIVKHEYDSLTDDIRALA